MGFEDRQYNRDGQDPRRSLPGFQFGQQSIVLSLIVVNFAIFLLDSFTVKVGTDGTHWLSKAMAIQTEHLWYVWTYLTYGFAHASFDTQTGIWHVGFNMLTLWFFGRPLERRYGRNEFLKFYLASIVVAGIGWVMLHFILNPDQPTFIVGASGAISAVLVLFVLLYPREQFLFFGVVPMPAWVLAAILFVSNLFYALDSNSHVAWEAHAVGAVFGLLYFKLGWSFEKFQFDGLSKRLGPRTKLRVHNPGASEEKLQQEVDQILAKISREGEEALSSKERKKLKKYSEQLRNNRDS